MVLSTFPGLFPRPVSQGLLVSCFLSLSITTAIAISTLVLFLVISVSEPVRPLSPWGSPQNQDEHCDTVGPHETLETIMTVWGVMEPRGHCDTARTHGAKSPL